MHESDPPEDDDCVPDFEFDIVEFYIQFHHDGF